jgi:glycosyltransferase involved in cell wall biosynthesis
MKVAIICGHFVPELGYVEVHLANAFHRLGHSVKVITSNKTSFSAKHISVNKKEILPFEIVRLKPWFSYGQIVKAKGVNKEIENFNPDKVFVIGLGKVFPKEVFNIKNRSFELVTLLGDNENTYNKSDKSLKRSFLQKFLKTPVYELAIKKSDRLIGYTLSTKEVVDSFIKNELKTVFADKYSETTLGFDETEFYYSTKNRYSLREDLGIKKDDFVLVTATRVTPAKNIEKIIDAIELLSKKQPHFKYVLIGFSETEYCQQLKDYISTKQLKRTIITLPFIDRKEMNNYYNIADAGLWTQAAISIFEGLATGLFLFLPSKKNMSHILNKETGRYYSEDELLLSLEKIVLDYNSDSRVLNANNVKAQFSFNNIAINLIKD